MKKLKLPPEVREQFDMLLVAGAGQWWIFEKRFVAAFAAAWLRLQGAERDALLSAWGKWAKGKKPQVWVKFVETLPGELQGTGVWTGYEPTGGIFTVVVPPCLSMTDNLLAVFAAREVRRALRVAQGLAQRDLPFEERQVRNANREAGYDEEALQGWMADHGLRSPESPPAQKPVA